jgi:hypothetical protein
MRIKKKDKIDEILTEFTYDQMLPGGFSGVPRCLILSREACE